MGDDVPSKLSTEATEDAVVKTSETGSPSMTGPRYVPLLWALLVGLFILLVALSVLLLVRSGIFGRGTPSNETLKAVWAFIGVALGAEITLFGALLTEQNNRRTAAREELV